MGRFADIDAEMAARLAARDAVESVERLAEVEPEEARRILTDTELDYYASLLEDADRSVARRNGVDMRSEFAMRSRELREQSARLDRRAEEVGRSFEEVEREADASRSLSGLADSIDEVAQRRWTRNGGAA